MPGLWVPPKPHIWTPPPGVLAERELEKIALRGNHPSYRPNARRSETPGKHGAAAAGGPTFVGGGTDSQNGGTDCSISLTGLTGGSGSTALENDLVIAVVSFSSGFSDSNMLMTTSGYTEVADLFANDTNNANLGVFYKFMGATPDTTAVGGADNDSSGYGLTMALHVWRGIDTTTPMDVTATTATGLNSGVADPPSITPSTSGAIIIICGGNATDQGTNAFTHSVFSNVFSIGYDGSSGDSAAGIASYDGWTSGAYNPAAFGFSGSGSTDGWCAVTMALRPAA